MTGIAPFPGVGAVVRLEMAPVDGLELLVRGDEDHGINVS